MDITYSPQIETEGLPGRAAPRLSDSVPSNTFGEGIGHAAEVAGAVAQGHFMDVQNQARQTQIMDAHNQFQGLAHGLQTEALSKQGKDAFGLDHQVMPQYQAAAQKIVDAVPDPRARRIAQLASDQIAGNLLEQVNGHEITQHREFANQTDISTVKVSQQAAANNYNHADILAQNKDNMDAALENMAQREGKSEQWLAEAKQEAHSSLHTDVLERMIGDGNDKMAKVYLNANKGEMDARTYETIATHIAAKEKEKQNEAKQGIADRYADSLRAAQYGLPNSIQVTRGEMNILYPKDSQRRWDELQIMQQAGAKAKEYDHMSLPEIEADLKGSAPKEGGPNALYEIEAQGIRERAAQRTLAARNADPAAFAQTRGNWNALDFSNPRSMMEELSSRSKTQGEVSDQIGMPVPLVSKQEAKQFASALSTASPQTVVGMLTQLHQGLSQPAYDSLLSQVAPHSPVTAVAGSLLDQPPKDQAPSWYNGKFGPDPDVASGIVNGERILSGKGEERAKGGFALPPDEDTNSKAGLATYFRNAAGGPNSNAFAGRPQTAEVYYGAFKAYYAHLAAKQGLMGGVIDPELATRAARAVLGDTVKFNHTDVSVPKGMDPTRFETLASEGIRQASLAAGIDPDLAKALQESGGLMETDRTLGKGIYAVVDGNGRTVGKDGKTLTVDMSKVSIPRELFSVRPKAEDPSSWASMN